MAQNKRRKEIDLYSDALLFRYRLATPNNLNAFADDTLYFSTPVYFNDPFEDYYGKSSMHCVWRLYPFIQYEDGVKWNVPYAEVTIGDFFRTFPNAKEKGLKIYANNVAGAGEFFERLLQDWAVYFEYAETILERMEY